MCVTTPFSRISKQTCTITYNRFVTLHKQKYLWCSSPVNLNNLTYFCRHAVTNLIIMNVFRAVNLYKLGLINGPFPIGKTLQNSQFSKLKIPNFTNLTLEQSIHVLTVF